MVETWARASRSGSLPNTIELMTYNVPSHIFVSGATAQLQQII